MQISLSPEAAELLKIELPAISTTYLNLSMPPWGTNTASPAAYLPIGPNPILGHVCLQLDRRAILSNIAFRPKRQTHLTRFSPREMAIKALFHCQTQLNDALIESRRMQLNSC